MVVSDKTKKKAVKSQRPPAKKAKVLSGVVKGAGIIVDPMSNGQPRLADVDVKITGPQMRFGVSVAGGKETSYISKLHRAAQASGNMTFIVDNQCAPDAGDVMAITGRHSALMKHCRVIDGVTDCEHGVLLITQLWNAHEIEDWKRSVHEYRMMNEIMPVNTLKFVSAWTCDSSDFKYYTHRSGWTLGLTKVMSRGSMCGFAAVEVPSDRTIIPLRNFMRQTADPSRPGFFRTTYNWITNLTWNMVRSRYTESNVPDLIRAMHTVGISPDVVSPESFGVLVEDGVPLGGTKYPYTPVLMPGISRLVQVPKLIALSKAASDIVGIFDLVRSGYVVDGVPASYRPAIDIYGGMLSAAGLITAAIGMVSFGKTALTTTIPTTSIIETAVDAITRFPPKILDNIEKMAAKNQGEDLAAMMAFSKIASSSEFKGVRVDSFNDTLTNVAEVLDKTPENLAHVVENLPVKEQKLVSAFLNVAAASQKGVSIVSSTPSEQSKLPQKQKQPVKKGAQPIGTCPWTKEPPQNCLVVGKDVFSLPMTPAEVEGMLPWMRRGITRQIKSYLEIARSYTYDPLRERLYAYDKQLTEYFEMPKDSDPLEWLENTASSPWRYVSNSIKERGGVRAVASEFTTSMSQRAKPVLEYGEFYSYKALAYGLQASGRIKDLSLSASEYLVQPDFESTAVGSVTGLASYLSVALTFRIFGCLGCVAPPMAKRITMTLIPSLIAAGTMAI